MSRLQGVLLGARLLEVQFVNHALQLGHLRLEVLVLVVLLVGTLLGGPAVRLVEEDVLVAVLDLVLSLHRDLQPGQLFLPFYDLFLYVAVVVVHLLGMGWHVHLLFLGLLG